MMKNILSTVHNDIHGILQEATTKLQYTFSQKNELLWKSGVQMSTAAVTRIDREIDDFLRNELKKKYPDFGFITEEAKSTKLQEYNWIIDPIDGTSNFAHKLPVFGISVALWKKNEPIYGIISFPQLNETIYAIKNHGVFLNNKRLEKHSDSMNPHLITCYDFIGENEEKIQFLFQIKDTMPFPINFQCSTFHIAMTALGRFDCAIGINLSLWDIAAAILIASEAGLSVEFLSPYPDVYGDYSGQIHSVIVAQNTLAEMLFKKLKS